MYNIVSPVCYSRVTLFHEVRIYTVLILNQILAQLADKKIPEKPQINLIGLIHTGVAGPFNIYISICKAKKINFKYLFLRLLFEPKLIVIFYFSVTMEENVQHF